MAALSSRARIPGSSCAASAKDYIQGKLAMYLDPKATAASLPTG